VVGVAMNEKQIQQHIEKQIYVDALNGVGVQSQYDAVIKELVVAVPKATQCLVVYHWNQKKLWEMSNDELLNLYKSQCQARLLKKQRGTIQ
jgi:hypothetical protein